MVCPRCGWIMRLLNIREHIRYSDELYQCKCGTTHLHIVPKGSRQELQPYLIEQKRVTI